MFVVEGCSWRDLVFVYREATATLTSRLVEMEKKLIKVLPVCMPSLAMELLYLFVY